MRWRWPGFITGFHIDFNKVLSNISGIDGTTSGLEREKLINNFNDCDSKELHLFLLSTRYLSCCTFNRYFLYEVWPFAVLFTVWFRPQAFVGGGCYFSDSWLSRLTISGNKDCFNLQYRLPGFFTTRFSRLVSDSHCFACLHIEVLLCNTFEEPVH